MPSESTMRVSIAGQLLAVPFLLGFLALRGLDSIAMLLAANALRNVQTASVLPVLGALLFLSVAWRLSAPRHGDAPTDIRGNRARVGARDCM